MDCFVSVKVSGQKKGSGGKKNDTGPAKKGKERYESKLQLLK